MTAYRLQGLIAAPFTPMNKNGSLNIELIPAYFDLLKSNGVSGAFICGSTGEGPSLTFEEKKLVAKAWGEATSKEKDFKVILFLGGTCLEDCIELASWAVETGIHAISMTAPFYFKPANIHMLAKSCAVVASAAPGLPFYYYHIPVLTGVQFPMLELLKAVDGMIPNFAGIKYTHEDLMDFMACRQFRQGKYDMLWGRDETLLSALVLGAKGTVGSTYNYAAPLYNDIIESYTRGDMKHAQELQMKSVEMIQLLGKFGGIATGKAYMKLIGLDCGGFRLPVNNMTPGEFEVFKSETKQINFNSYASCLRINASTQ